MSRVMKSRKTVLILSVVGGERLDAKTHMDASRLSMYVFIVRVGGIAKGITGMMNVIRYIVLLILSITFRCIASHVDSRSHYNFATTFSSSFPFNRQNSGIYKSSDNTSLPRIRCMHVSQGSFMVETKVL